ncbi:unnamed protein product [Boreogadus saida]
MNHNRFRQGEEEEAPHHLSLPLALVTAPALALVTAPALALVIAPALALVLQAQHALSPGTVVLRRSAALRPQARPSAAPISTPACRDGWGEAQRISYDQ